MIAPGKLYTVPSIDSVAPVNVIVDVWPAGNPVGLITLLK
jgi:hypothetical protein